MESVIDLLVLVLPASKISLEARIVELGVNKDYTKDNSTRY